MTINTITGTAMRTRMTKAIVIRGRRKTGERLILLLRVVCSCTQPLTTSPLSAKARYVDCFRGRPLCGVPQKSLSNVSLPSRKPLIAVTASRRRQMKTVMLSAHEVFSCCTKTTMYSLFWQCGASYLLIQLFRQSRRGAISR